MASTPQRRMRKPVFPSVRTRRGTRRLNRQAVTRSFLPQWDVMEERVLLATMRWVNAGTGDWNVAANWVNSTNSADHHVPNVSDDAQINTPGITVTHTSAASDS